MKSLALSLLLGSIPLLAQSPQNAEPNRPAQVLKLEPDKCPVIRMGDTIVLSLKPLLTPELEVLNYTATFIKDDVSHDTIDARGNTGVIFQGERTSKDGEGFWNVAFKVTEFNLSDGKYELRELEGQGIPNDHYQGQIARQNSIEKPDLLKFCVKVHMDFPLRPTGQHGIEIRPAH